MGCIRRKIKNSWWNRNGHNVQIWLTTGHSSFFLIEKRPELRLQESTCKGGGPGKGLGREMVTHTSALTTEPLPRGAGRGPVRLNAVWILNALANTTRRTEKQKLWGINTAACGADLPLASRQLRHDQMEQDPTEPHTGRSTFLLSSGCAGITEWPVVRGPFLLRTSFPARCWCAHPLF